MAPTSEMNTERLNAERRMNLQGMDAFLALSQVYLDCVEHLAQSTVEVSRGTLAECVAAAKASVTGNAAAVPAAVGQSLMEKVLSYSRDSFETVTNAQLQSAQIVGRQFGMPALGLPMSTDWKGAFDTFTRPFRDAAAAGESAAAAGRARVFSPLSKTV